ncbi:MAG: helix-turn-helix transcriptional regulator [Bryobacteraceae bacterium]|nr:ArsR family transcriptional regulator [Bryobacterales bacterium]MEB2359816.1 ArsR family transcriptional regulator [Bryobacterales bacterium]NUN02653.1 helix-turn-helix transcriptional regulator [Bryobacteraceae bacterium]
MCVHPWQFPYERETLDLLRDGPKATGELCGHFDSLEQCTVMQHLRVLEAADLILVKRQGRQQRNYIHALPIKEISERWISQYSVSAVDLLARMKLQMGGGGGG